MALINVENVEVLDNPASFLSPFRFLITFECVAPGIKEELEWKLIYIGSAEDEKYDQELDAILVGPVNIGRNKFEFTAPAPDPSRIPEKDLVEVTAILLTCSYKNKEFIRVGYYVNNYVEGEEAASSSSSSASSSLPTPSARPDFVDAAAAVAQREAEAQAQPPAPMQSEPMAADANSASAQPRENGAPNGTDVGADSGSGVAEAAASAPQDMEVFFEQRCLARRWPRQRRPRGRRSLQLSSKPCSSRCKQDSRRCQTRSSAESTRWGAGSTIWSAQSRI